VLRDRICLLVHPPGTMLSENKLAREFGVSRTPIRRVLQALEFDGLVESTPGVGTIVTTLDLRYLKQVYALRLKLIDLIGELPAGGVRRRPDSSRSCWSAPALRDEPDPAALAEVYQSFHETLSCVIGNRPLREISDRYFVSDGSRVAAAAARDGLAPEVDAVVDEISEVVTEALARDWRRSPSAPPPLPVVPQRMNAVLAGDDLVGGRAARERG
jgi:DNA-binding GntR family transcriptional regulator